MAAQDPLPTFLIGVGEAGIETLETMKKKIPEEEAAYFDYLAIDSNNDYLGESSIEKSLYLQPPDTLVGRLKDQFPFLADDIQFGVKGAERQRPVGRFKLDNPDQPSFSDNFESIQGHIRRFRQEHSSDITQQNKHINIILVNSLSGGTGSGTYPLLTAIIHYLADSIREQNQMFAYFAGFGIISEFKFGRNIVDLPGDDGRYYANSYAGMRDLQRLLNAGDEEPLRLPVHSRRITESSDGVGTSDAIEDAMEENAFEFEFSPFNDYFLVGVNEDLIDGERSFVGNERYDQVIDNQIAESIYTIAKHGQAMENVSGVSDTDSRVGTIIETEVSVPHEQLVEYHETKREIEELETLLFAGQGLPDVIDTEAIDADIEDGDELDMVKFLVRNPSVVFETMDDDRAEETKNDIDEKIDATFGGGLNVVNRTPSDIDDLIEEVEQAHDLRVTPYVLDVVEERVNEQAPTARENREETVREMWGHYELSSHPEYGDVSSITQRVRNLEDFLREEIEETRVELETADESFWDGKPGLRGTREKLEDRLSDRKEALEKLQEVVNDHESVGVLDDGVSERRSDIERRLKQKKRDLGDARDTLKSLRNELVEPQSGRRLAQMPITESAFEDVTLDELQNELTDIEAYIDKGYVDEDDFKAALAIRFERGYEDEEKLILQIADDDVNDELVRQFNELGREETTSYIEYHEANEEVVEFDKVQIGVSESDFNRYTDDRHNPYRVKFVTYVRTGPIEILKTYRQLESYAEDGDLDELVGKRWGGDHRLAFAYPEWYGRDIQRRFDVDKTLELPHPPAPEIEYVDFDAENEGELCDEFISRNGVVSYLYHGVLWENYEDGATDFRGWNSKLEEVGIGWPYFQELSPPAEEKRQWLEGNREWEEILEAYQRTLEEQEGIKVDFVEELEITSD